MTQKWLKDGVLLHKSQGFLANVSNPQGGKSTDFSAGKCHLLYFVVVPESLTFGSLWGHSAGVTFESLCFFLCFCRVRCTLTSQCKCKCTFAGVAPFRVQDRNCKLCTALTAGEGEGEWHQLSLHLLLLPCEAVGLLEAPKLGLAKNHPWILTTLGCRGAPDPRNFSVEKFPGSSNPSVEGSLGWAYRDGQSHLRESSGTYRLRNCSGQEFPGIQGWWASKGGSWPGQKTPKKYIKVGEKIGQK